ncbi:MAG: hypothetical protein HC843_13485 [Sphingomonadales bacterium]|nr:hypothetical protein [Sphingomonadales bacterium]
MSWLEMKLMVSEFTGLENDALHIYAALITQFIFAIIFRRSLGCIWPWLAVLAFAICNEWFDNKGIQGIMIMQQAAWHESIKDICNTMVAPSFLLTVSALFPEIFVRRATQVQNEEFGKSDKMYAQQDCPS